MSTDLIRSALTTEDFAPMSQVENDVRKALVVYKFNLVNANYRGVNHRIFCWFKSPESLAIEAALCKAKDSARAVVNRSPAHQQIARMVAAAQPECVRAKDGFLDLIQPN